MINSTYPEVKVNNNYLAAVMHQKDMIRALAVQLVAGQVEAHLSMINNYAEETEFGNFQEISECIAGAKDSTKDYIADLLAEFESELLEAIAKVEIKTASYTVKLGGEIDADVYVE